MKLSSIFITAIFLCIISASSFSQEAKINWGPTEKAEKSDGNLYALGWHDGHFYTFRSRYNSMGQNIYYLEKVDKDLTLVFSKKLEMKDYSFSYPVLNNDHLYLYQVKNEGISKKSMTIAYNKYNLEGDFVETIEIVNVDEVKKFNQLTSRYIYALSPDKKQLGITIVDNLLKEDQVKLFNVRISTENPSDYEVNSTSIKVSEEANGLSLSQLAIANSGSMVTCVGAAKRNYGSFGQVDPYLYRLVSWNSTKGYSEPLELKFDNVYFDKLTIKSIGKSFFMAGLLLTQTNNKESHNGFFLSQINIENNTIKSFSSFPYTTEFFESLGYKVKSSGKIKFDGSFEIDIIPSEAGGGYLMAEHVDRNYQVTTPNKITYEVVSIPFDETGKFGKQSVLLKNQIAYNKQLNGIGYFAFSKGTDLYVIYNDHLKNLEAAEVDDLKAENKFADNSMGTLIAKLEKEGDFKREVLFTYKEQDGYLVPEKCSSKEGLTLIHIADGKEVRYGTLGFE